MAGTLVGTHPNVDIVQKENTLLQKQHYCGLRGSTTDLWVDMRNSSFQSLADIEYSFQCFLSARGKEIEAGRKV